MKNTKRSNRISRAVVTRVLMMVLLLALIGGVLTSCAAGSSVATSLQKTDITDADMTADNRLTSTQLDDIADDIAKSGKNALTIRAQLVAALNGYNMTAADFDDSKIPLPGEEPAADAPKAEPEKAGEFAEKVLKRFDIDLPINASADKSLLSTADVQVLVDSFQISVDPDAKLGLIDQILNWIGIGFGWLIEVPGFGSFILGTLYFAIVLEILMLPLGINQQKNSRKQARLRPKEMAIRNKYKGRNDQATMQKLNQEIQNLYSKEGYSPMSGCLPMLLTLPFLMFLYYIVIDPLTYMMGAPTALSNAFLTFASAPRAAGGLGITLESTRGTIEVLSLIRESGMSLDGLKTFAYLTEDCRSACFEALNGVLVDIPDFTLFGLNMGKLPSNFTTDFAANWWLLLVPVLTFITYWGTGKISRKFTFQPMQNQGDPAQGCSNGMMNIMMPAMSAFFTFMVPAAVGLYWIFKSLIGMAKQFVLYKVMPLPVFTEEDYKAAERELMGKEKNKPVKKSGSKNPDVRSLHHIDDEDYESPAEREARLAARKADYVEPEDEAHKKTADTAYAEGVTLKEDDRLGRAERKRQKSGKKDKAAPAEETPADSDTETDNRDD